MKEGYVVDIPCMNTDNCTGCGTCVAVCPHAEYPDGFTSAVR